MLWICQVYGADCLSKSFSTTGSGTLSAMTHGSSDHEDVHSRWRFSGRNMSQPSYKACFNHTSSKFCLSILSLENAQKPALVLRNLSELQQLTIRMVGPFEPALTQFFPCMPFTLRSLEVIGPSFDLTRLDSLNPVLPHLTNVRIDMFNSIACLRLLQLAPNLSSLSIGITFIEIQALTPFTHTKLQSLRIVNVMGFADQLPDLFNALSFPNLRVLEARSVPKWPHEELKAFLARSSCPLERLVLGVGMATDKQQAEYVALIPSLALIASPCCTIN